MTGVIRLREELSQCASGSPARPSTIVVMAASFNVRPSDCQSGKGRRDQRDTDFHSTVTDLARFRGLSTSQPRSTAM